MGCTACTERQCLYKGALYLFFYHICNSWLTNSISHFMCTYIYDLFQYWEQFIRNTVICNVMLCSLFKWIPTFIILGKPPLSIFTEKAGYNGSSSFVQNVCIILIWCNIMQVFIYCKITLNMFRASIAPIVRSTQNCNCSLWYMS